MGRSSSWDWVRYAGWNLDRRGCDASDVVGVLRLCRGVVRVGPGRGVVWQCESGSGAFLGALGHLGGFLARRLRRGLGSAGVARRFYG